MVLESTYWPHPYESLNALLEAFGMPSSKFGHWRLTPYVLGYINGLQSSFAGRLAATNGILCLIIDRSTMTAEIGHLQYFVCEELDEQRREARYTEKSDADSDFVKSLMDFGL